MSTHEITATRSPYVERAVAIGTSIAPIATGILAPLLDPNAAFTATLAYGAVAGITATNYMNRLSEQLLRNLPAGDVIKAHRSPLFIATLTSGMALALGTLEGLAGADALMAGALSLPSVPGVLSLAWWGAVGLVPWQLRLVLGGHRRSAARLGHPVKVPAQRAPRGPAQEVVSAWAAHISGRKGSHPGQELTLATLGSTRWTGVITAPIGQAATVTAEAVSSVYRIPAQWIVVRPGEHAGQQHIAVHLVAPPEADASTLEGVWLKRVARRGGLMPGTHLEDVQIDPSTDATVAYVVAGEELDALPKVDPILLAGALRMKNRLLLSYEAGDDPRRAVVRVFKRNPLEVSTPLPGAKALEISKKGYLKVGLTASGAPAKLQVTDPNVGSLHLGIFGVTGAGKGGVILNVALALHLAGFALIYVDPKGTSNPAVEDMAAYTGKGLQNSSEGSIGALRVAYALMEHRKTLPVNASNNFDTAHGPHLAVIVDEVDKLVTDPTFGKEATSIISALASQTRSLGISLILAGQVFNADKIGGTDIRNNVFNGGSLVLLRTDSAQTQLTDLPESFDGVNPARIPATWTPKEPVLIYTEDDGADESERTFGLGYISTGAPVMFRSWFLTTAMAREHIRPGRPVPADWPEWDQAEEIANCSILGDGDAFEELDLGSIGTSKPRELTVKERIVAVLEAAADPLGLEVIYVHRDDIQKAARLDNTATMNNKLGELVREGRIHRKPGNGKDAQGWYGLGGGAEDQD